MNNHKKLHLLSYATVFLTVVFTFTAIPVFADEYGTPDVPMDSSSDVYGTPDIPYSYQYGVADMPNADQYSVADVPNADQYGIPDIPYGDQYSVPDTYYDDQYDVSDQGSFANLSYGSNSGAQLDQSYSQSYATYTPSYTSVSTYTTPTYYIYGNAPQATYAQPVQYTQNTIYSSSNTSNISNASTQSAVKQYTTYGVDCQIYFSRTSSGAVTLNWRSLNATTGTISPGIGSVNPTSGSRTVNPTYGQMYTLTARGSGGAAECMSDPYTGSAAATVQTYYPYGSTPGAQQSSASYSTGTSDNASNYAYGNTASNHKTYTASAQAAAGDNNGMVTATAPSDDSAAPQSQSSTRPHISLSQIPMTGIDSDLLWTAFIMISLITALITIMYILYRTEILFVILGVYR